MKTPSIKDINILVVEDNIGDYMLISEFLNQGFDAPRIQQTETYAQTNDLINQSQEGFDVILLDLSLPDAEGESLITKVMSFCKNIPVIILTGNNNLKFALKALNLGVTDYLIKNDISAEALYKSIVFSMERNEIEEQLHKSKKEYQDLYSLSPLPIFIYDVNTLKFLDVNKATEVNYGYTKDEFLEMTLLDIQLEKENKSLSNVNESLKNENQTSTKGTAQHKKKNGELMQVQIDGFTIEYQNKPAETIIINDITKQKKYEDEILDVNIKLRNLTAHLQKVREEERIAISREIHDELGQQLTGIKLDASWLKNTLETVKPEVNDRAYRLIESINKTIQDVRKISTNLRPGVLDDLGLEAAIEWKTTQFEDQTGIKCTLAINCDMVDFGGDINTAIFRIYQEALTNIARHSNATEVKVLLETKDNQLILQVIDNGRGISEVEKMNTISLGLVGMKERALMLKGDFFIENLNGHGTKLKVLVPLNI